jgi:predicted secreted protein
MTRSSPVRWTATLIVPLLALYGAVSTGSARAAEPASAPPRDVLSLTASAVVEQPYDTLAITLSTTKEGSDPGAVQAQLRQAVDAALTDARRAARPGQIDVRTGAFSLGPRYTNKGLISGWVGQAEVLLEGRDMGGIAQLAGRLATLTVARVAYSLARETREKAEAEASAQAIARFRAKAVELAKQFGYSGYTISEVSVGVDAPVQPLLRARAMSASVASDESIPVEAGKASVNVNVNGSVVMTR